MTDTFKMHQPHVETILPPERAGLDEGGKIMTDRSADGLIETHEEVKKLVLSLQVAWSGSWWSHHVGRGLSPSSFLGRLVNTSLIHQRL